MRAPPTARGRAARRKLGTTHDHPEAETTPIGAEEPGRPVHAPDESVDPGGTEDRALAEAPFPSTYATSHRGRG
ncbi:hypothetical protein ACFY8W_05320 [Streptomyces sp. NPDC012637]|uniref:hypothetical protein n=1 Tax=Streptomyces sp. NPDC012637 TaxID=3364842 RepID=UPI0036F16DAE